MMARSSLAAIAAAVAVLGAAGAAVSRQAAVAAPQAKASQGAAPRAVAPPAAQPVPAPAIDTESGVPVYAADVVARFPHDSGAFTEGLLFCGGALYESTGKEGASDIRRVTLDDGKVVARARLSPQLFGEGIACWQKSLASVTWKTGIGFRWALPALTQTGKPFRYAGEGWGMTSDATSILLSDGTPVLRRMDPVRFAERGRLAVTLNGRPLKNLNELEYVGGKILANVWMSGFIARIDPASGKVEALIDLRPLIAEINNPDPDAVANGIAYDAAHDRLFVTGKYWPTLFEIKLGDEVGRAR
ncbi:glutamine cyclotransferase [Arthrobacter sp. TPD3018]|uniref:glutaminyl-peptide cyclotransferase n=1 Tax=Bacteria TaxID=2 RepID=UPI000D50C37E|nr:MULTISPECIES: glutaminyl-peptide cyclotransferase [Bacteria]PVE51727.1 glutamine cyclotransferase [Sphingomonas sp. TPD3009]PVE52551.1 glutamine cyclotransferase [Arthrobacter sp. TPD3018]PVE80678.1 glutamine cyclotransferase [Sphingomonas melonis]